MDDFMLNIISMDFDVDLLTTNDGKALFYAQRDYLIHFVVYQNGMIQQLHIPRFVLAERYSIVLSGKYDDRHVFFINKFLGVTKGVDDSLSLIVNGDKYNFNKKDNSGFYGIIINDVKKYEQGRKMIERNDGGCVLKDVVSAYGKDIFSDECNIELLSAIAFETLVSESKNKKTLSIFLLYSKFLAGKYKFTKSIVNKIIKTLNSIYIDENLNAHIDRIYNKLVENKILRELEEDKPDLSEYTKYGFNNLSETGRAVFAELTARVKGHFILLFGYAASLIDKNELIEILTEGCQPDSKYEQETRSILSIVDEFKKMVKKH